MPSLVGRKLGQYEILEEIGHGGMADVYRAVQSSMGREVALKVLPTHFLQDRTFLERFAREVRVISQLQHPHILPVYDFGEDDGLPYIVMAHIPGGALADRIEESSGGLPFQDVVRITDQVARALDYAHKQGIIHRDLKPSNILLDREGNAYLSDFGIAKVTEATAQLTGSGIVGTPAYMAPEMARRGGVTPLIDVYALGVTLYQMLTGQLPYEADTPMGTLMAHGLEPIPDARTRRADIPDGVQYVVEHAMAKDPKERYLTAVELAADLSVAIPAERPATAQATPRAKAPSSMMHTPDAIVETPQPEPPGGATLPLARTPPREHRIIEAPPRPSVEIPEMEEKPAPPFPINSTVVGAVLVVWATLLLLKNLGILTVSLWGLVCPLALLIAGIVVMRGVMWRKGRSRQLVDTGVINIPLEGAEFAHVRFGAGIIIATMTGDAPPDHLMAGRFNSGLDWDVRREGAVMHLDLRTPPFFAPMFWGPRPDFRWNFALNPAIPLTVTVKGGVGMLDLDMTDLYVADLDVSGYMGQARIQMPANAGYVQATIKGNVGTTNIYIPSGVPVRIRAMGGTGSLSIDRERFPRVERGIYQSPDYDEAAANRIDMRVDGGLGTVSIK